MPSRTDALLIADMVENAEAVAQFVEGQTYGNLVGNCGKLYAVVRAFEIIGEAAKLFLRRRRRVIRSSNGG